MGGEVGATPAELEDPASSATDDAPRRVLIVSADVGEGHNATGRALAEAAAERWPGCAVDWLDLPRVLGPGVGRVFRGLYALHVRAVPAVYEFFYTALRRHHALASVTRDGMGAWIGHGLAPHVAARRPDLVLSTYPLASAGLAWMRRHGRLPCPAAAWVSDFAPHPFWVYRELDLTYVMHEVAVPWARRAEPDARVAVSPLPVVRAFRPVPEGARGVVRERLGVPDGQPLALVSGGAFGFGAVEEIVDALLTTRSRWHPLVLCGRNRALERRLRGRLRGVPDPSRVHVLGWVDDASALLAAADAVVTNAGGATSLEALAAGRPLLMFRPIAGHGRANARLMTESGLAHVCRSGPELAAWADLVAAGRPPQRPRTGTRRPGTHGPGTHGPGTEPGDLGGALDAVVRAGASPRARSLPPGDAMFLAVDTPAVPQQIGAVIVLEPGGGGGLTRDVAAELATAIPGIGGRLVRGRAWRRARWVPLPDADGRDVVSCRRVDGDSAGTLERETDELFGERLDLGGPAARVRLLDGLPGGRQALLVQVHHALCDGVILTRALVAKGLDVGASDATRPAGRSRARHAAGPDPETRRGHTGGPARDRHGERRSLRLGCLSRGTLALLRAGQAPRTVLQVPVRGPARRHVLVDLPAPEVRRAARAHGCSTAELLLGLLAESLAQAVPGIADGGPAVRVMVPRTFRGREDPAGPASGAQPGADRAPFAGNRTGAAPVDLPVAAMPVGTRLGAVRDALRRQTATGQPAAARGVVRLMGSLPPPVARWASRRAYSGRWFGAIATVLPGIEREVRVRGVRVAQVYPVLPLAPGVNLAVGAVPRRDVVGVCLTLGPALFAHADALARSLPGALRAVLTERPAG